MKSVRKLFNKFNTLVFFMLHILPVFVESSNHITCEKYENHFWETDNVTLATCLILEQAVDNPGYSISSSKDENVLGLWFDHNRKIFYLPENISDKFPNLVGLSAELCSIKALRRENFKNLHKLKYLWLTQNSLEMIPSNTFDDLVALETLHLRKFQLHVIL